MNSSRPLYNQRPLPIEISRITGGPATGHSGLLGLIRLIRRVRSGSRRLAHRGCSLDVLGDRGRRRRRLQGCGLGTLRVLAVGGMLLGTLRLLTVGGMLLGVSRMLRLLRVRGVRRLEALRALAAGETVSIRAKLLRGWLLGWIRIVGDGGRDLTRSIHGVGGWIAISVIDGRLVPASRQLLRIGVQRVDAVGSHLALEARADIIWIAGAVPRRRTWAWFTSYFGGL